MSQYETWSLIVSVLTMIFLAIYVWKTWQISTSNKEMVKASTDLLRATRDARTLEYSPYLIMYFEFTNHVAHLVVRNIGKTPALKVKLDVEPDIDSLFLDTTHLEYWNKIKKFGISQIVPNGEVRIFINTSPGVASKIGQQAIFTIYTEASDGLLRQNTAFKISQDISEDIKRPYVITISDDAKEISKSINELKKVLVQTITKYPPCPPTS